MSTKGQVLVAVVLAGLVVGTFVRNSGPDDVEPMLVTQARLRQARGRSPGESPAMVQALRLGRILTGDEQYGRGLEESGCDESDEDELGGLPVFGILGLLSGGDIRIPDRSSSPGGEYDDWEFLERADSVVLSPRFQKLLRSALGADLGSLGTGGQ